MIEKKMTIDFTGVELEQLEKKYNCDRKTLNRAINYARAQFEEHIAYNLHDDVHDATLDEAEGTQL
jgi:Mor family transcriptional regulator